MPDAFLHEPFEYDPVCLTMKAVLGGLEVFWCLCWDNWVTAVSGVLGLSLLCPSQTHPTCASAVVVASAAPSRTLDVWVRCCLALPQPLSWHRYKIRHKGGSTHPRSHEGGLAKSRHDGGMESAGMEGWSQPTAHMGSQGGFGHCPPGSLGSMWWSHPLELF